VIISGSAILPEFLPDAGRIIGQALPTGAGVEAIRDSLYFPDASLSGPITVLALYAGIGLVATLLINALWPTLRRRRNASLTGSRGQNAPTRAAPASPPSRPRFRRGRSLAGSLLDRL
jgi:hypothetical protein